MPPCVPLITLRCKESISLYTLEPNSIVTGTGYKVKVVVFFMSLTVQYFQSLVAWIGTVGGISIKSTVTLMLVFLRKKNVKTSNSVYSVVPSFSAARY